MSYVVLIRFSDRVGVEVRGPYRSFKQASADAKAWDGVNAQSATVEPVVSIDGYKRLPQHLKLFSAALGPCGK